MIEREKIIKLCQTKAKNLNSLLYNKLKEYGYAPINTKDYIIAEGNLPICLVAHLDTVFPYAPQEFFFDPSARVLWSPDGAGFDDRVGVYIILDMLAAGHRPSIVFTTGEEIGGIGARKLVSDYKECPFKECRAIIELDRAWENDSVFYQCDNKDFEKYINKYGFVTSIGTFTDISIIAPEWGIAAVNLSVGYLEEHTHQERLYFEWTNATIEKLKEILTDSPSMLSYAYIPMKYTPYRRGQRKNTSILDDYFAGPVEEDEFDDYNNCLFCGRAFGKDVHRNIINYPNYSYAVCDDCKGEYLS